MTSNPQNSQEFTALTAYPVFYRTYSRQLETSLGARRESYQEASDRALRGLAEVGKLTDSEVELISKAQAELKAFPSGRWLWVGGTDWVKKPEHYYGGYNCNSTTVDSWETFANLMNLAMQGCGTGAVLEPRYIDQLPVISNLLNVLITGEIGTKLAGDRQDETRANFDNGVFKIVVGDSRQGWVDSYYYLLVFSSLSWWTNETKTLDVEVDLSNVRPAGEKLKQFGGVANPVKLRNLYGRIAEILNTANGRKLNSVECSLLIDEAALVVVAGNVRRSAGMRQGDADDKLFETAKDNLWVRDDQGNWSIDPKRDALRMANHTRVFHHKPSLDECISSVRKQYYSGEGAIQWAGGAIARASCDVLDTQVKRDQFLELYGNIDNL